MSDKGSALAEVRARTALQAAGLDPATPLERVSSVTNEVWLTPTHAVRVNRSRGGRLAREARVAAVLPESVGYPRVVAHGHGQGEDWMVSERVAGRPLAHLWPEMTRQARRSAIRQLGDRVGALHRTTVPSDLPPVHDPPQLLDASSREPVRPVLDALGRAARLDHVDPLLLLHDARLLVERAASALEPLKSTTFVHGDLTFENLLWHDGQITALLDVEWARPGPPDLDLDVLLRCAAHPALHVAEDHVDRTHADDYADVARWLFEFHPALFDHPRVLDRLRIYSIAYDVRALLASPPTGPPRGLAKHHPYNRLVQVVQGHSYLDVLGRRLP